MSCFRTRDSRERTWLNMHNGYKVIKYKANGVRLDSGDLYKAHGVSLDSSLFYQLKIRISFRPFKKTLEIRTLAKCPLLQVMTSKKKQWMHLINRHEVDAF